MKHYDIFISSSRIDDKISHKISTALRTNGFTIFPDINNIPKGEDIRECIVESIETSSVLLVICTPNSMQSNWVRNEITYALKHNKIIIPIIVDNVELSGYFLFHFRAYDYVHFDSINPDQSIQQLIKSIKYIVHKRQSIPTEKPSNVGEDKIQYEESNNETIQRRTTIKDENSFEKIVHLLRNIGIGLIFILYVIFVSFIFVAKNYGIGIFWLSPLIIGLIVYVIRKVKLSKYDLKLYCEEENAEADSLIAIHVDDKVISTINGKGFIKLSERKGTYLISIESKNKSIESERFEYTFNKSNHGSIKRVILKSKISKNLIKEQQNDLTRFMCFIAGSTRLVNERNAPRAVLSILYNKWERYNLVISSYTFEDFSNSYTVGGQQMHYDEFIEKKANCAIFIVENGVGEKTLEEYKLAIHTFENNLQRPKIFVYANQLNQDVITLQFIEAVRKNQSYWREYQSINQLMSLIKEDIDGELFNIFVLNNRLQ